MLYYGNKGTVLVPASRCCVDDWRLFGKAEAKAHGFGGHVGID